MALIKCRECKAKISSKAKTCPQCGIKIKKKGNFFPFLIFFLVLIAISNMGNDTNEYNNKEESTVTKSEEINNFQNELNELIKIEKLADAQNLIEKSSNHIKNSNEIKTIKEEIQNFDSHNFLVNSIIDLNNDQLAELSNDTFQKKYFSNEILNKKFIYKIKDNISKREQFIKDEKNRIRQENIQKQFSPWDGSHYKLVRYIKNSMHDPRSFKHDNTNAFDKGNYLLVTMTFRGKNAFGAIILNTVIAKISLDNVVLEVEYI